MSSDDRAKDPEIRVGRWARLKGGECCVGVLAVERLGVGAANAAGAGGDVGILRVIEWAALCDIRTLRCVVPLHQIRSDVIGARGWLRTTDAQSCSICHRTVIVVDATTAWSENYPAKGQENGRQDRNAADGGAWFAGVTGSPGCLVHRGAQFTGMRGVAPQQEWCSLTWTRWSMCACASLRYVTLRSRFSTSNGYFALKGA